MKTTAPSPTAPSPPPTPMLATIQHKEYFRASKLGEGSFGSVITVYDEDGGEFACKVFDQSEEDGGDEDEDEEWEEGGGSSGLDVGVLRELSILRLLNGAHPNIMRMVDVSNIEDHVRGSASALVPPPAAQQCEQLLT